MNYYPFHLGDYATHAGHLNPVEDCAYRRLIDLYMLTEQPLPLDVEQLARKIRMREYQAELVDVLHEFFTRTDDAWTHSRCDKEIDKFRRASEAASKAGKLSALQRKATTAQRPLHERPTPVQPTKTQDPRTKNQEPRKDKDKNKEGQQALLLPEWMPIGVWKSWRQHRKTIRKPLTEAAEELTLRNLAEMVDAGHDPVATIERSIANGWTGVFPPTPPARASPAGYQTALDKQADVLAKILRVNTAQPLDIFDEPRLPAARD